MNGVHLFAGKQDEPDLRVLFAKITLLPTFSYSHARGYAVLNRPVFRINERCRVYLPPFFFQ